MSFGEAEFCSFHEQNPRVYDLLRYYAYEAKQNGFRKLSIWLLANRVRWQVNILTQGSQFKLPNGTLAYYSRLLMAKEPDLQGFFDTRPLKDGEPAWT